MRGEKIMSKPKLLLTPNKFRRFASAKTLLKSKKITKKTFDTYEEFMCDKLQIYIEELKEFHKKVKRAGEEICLNYKFPIVKRSNSQALVQLVYKPSHNRGKSSISALRSSKSGYKTLLECQAREVTYDNPYQRRIKCLNGNLRIRKNMKPSLRVSTTEHSFENKQLELSSKNEEKELLRVELPDILPNVKHNKK